MPFVQRVVKPVFIARSNRSTTSPTKDDHQQPSTPSKSYQNGTASNNQRSKLFNESGQDNIASISGYARSKRNVPVNDHELESVTNLTLSNALKQLASLVLIANDIFTELNKDLRSITDRSAGLKQRIGALEQTVSAYDPKMVAVPESDLATFVQIKNHFKAKLPVETSLFTPQTRTPTIQELYEAAALTPVYYINEMDKILGLSDRSSSEIFLCTPILGQTRKRMKTKVDVEIETRLPSAIEDLRKWTSLEAIGDCTVTPMNATMTSAANLSTSVAQHSNTWLSITPPSPLSPSSNDEADTITVISNTNSRHLMNLEPVNNMPLDHRLPSPEEQCQILVSKFPAELIRVDITGRRFDRMSHGRKSLIHFKNFAIKTRPGNSTSPDGQTNGTDQIDVLEEVDANGESQTVRRRSRTRKPRGKRRNTLAGTDQKEIEEAAQGETRAALVDDDPVQSPSDIDDLLIPIRKIQAKRQVPRSKSSDILKKDTGSTISSAASTDYATKSLTLSSHFNSLKQWGKNRFRMMNRLSNISQNEQQHQHDSSNSANNNGNSSGAENNGKKVSDIDDFNVHETMAASSRRSGKRTGNERDRTLSHERKPSYSSSEKSLPLSISSQTNHSLPASINPVKMRESASIRRQRRIGLGYKEEPNNSSSGNWSASSESGRTSIGSEITVQPKSSASSNSLNHVHHPGSGPPSSIISRRRFFNTSASSSVTSEGTATPDLNMHDMMFDDMETSSAYSCDTEGYYTSFHVDSGLKTLKEEEPSTPLHVSSALSSTNSFSSGNQTVVENEYELFGRGSTSTTTSSAGTICTTLMAGGSDRSLIAGPAVPERKSSLTKLNRSNSTSSNRNSIETLERSYSSSTMGSASTLERMGTIKRNGVLLQKEITVVTVHPSSPSSKGKDSRMESPDSGNNTSTSPVESTGTPSSPTQVRSCSEFEYSESSDLEGVERIERIRTKTTINSSRIPSLCVITPSNSDDEGPMGYIPDHDHILNTNVREKLATPICAKKKLLIETDLDKIDFRTTVDQPDASEIITPPVLTTVDLKKEHIQHVKKTTLLPLNTVFGRLIGVLQPLNKKSPLKSPTSQKTPDPGNSIYDVAGEYVRISDVNNQRQSRQGAGIYYSNDVVKRNLATVLSGNLNDETEYVSLNELPCIIRAESNLLADGDSSPSEGGKEKAKKSLGNQGMKPKAEELPKREDVGLSKGDDGDNNNKPIDINSGGGFEKCIGARVSLDAHGKPIYNSDSLKRRKGAHTTFAPGACVKKLGESKSEISVEPKLGQNAAPSTPLLNRPESIVKPLRTSIGTALRQTTVDQQQQVIEPRSSTISTNTNTQNVNNNSVISNHHQSSIPRSTSSNVINPTSPVNDPAFQKLATTYQEPTSSSVLLDEEESRNLLEMIPSSMGPLKNSGAYSTLPKHEKTYSQPVAVVAQQSGGYQPLYHNIAPVAANQDEARGQANPRPIYETTDEARTDSSQYGAPSPFQRNNVYWTLQTQNRRTAKVNGINVEDLYSTPNKLSKTRAPSASGLSTFFQPRPEGNTLNTSLIETNEPISPINPRNITEYSESSILTSTPTGRELNTTASPSKPTLTDELRNKLRMQNPVEGIRSHGNSPNSSGRSTPRSMLEPQQTRGRHSWANDSVEIPQTCSDRMGTPKTSLMDFKKLLLSKAAGSRSGRSSAVEQLLLKKPTVTNPVRKVEEPKSQGVQSNKGANLSSLKIQDLSGSPKTFANRRMLRNPINYGSPGRNVTSPGKPTASSSTNVVKTIKHDIMSTSIPENEEENSSPVGSIKTGGLLRQQSSEEHSSPSPPPSPAPSSLKDNIISGNLKLRENFFLKTEENNFMKHEILSKNNANSFGANRKQLVQQQRQQFLGYSSSNNNNKFVLNRNLGKGKQLSAIAEGRQNSPPPSSDRTSPAPGAPSLETAL